MKLHRIQYAGSSLTLKFSGTMLSTRITKSIHDFSSSVKQNDSRVFRINQSRRRQSATLFMTICGKIAPHRCRNSVRH